VLYKISPVFRACLVLALVGSTPAVAQSVATQSGSDILVVAPSTTPLDQVAQVDKLGVAIGDVPRSIQIVPRELIDQQGGTELRDTLRNVSGLSQGGQFAFGFFDRFIIRGLNPSYLDDGLPDGTSDLSGYVHSLTGVECVEVLKGPGSALFGSAEPGGSINLVHYKPTDQFSAKIGEQYGSYNTTTTTLALNGPTGISNLDARFDGEYQHSHGFRGQRNETGEALASLGWHPSRHDVLVRFEYHHLENTPDSAGLPFAPLSTGATSSLPINVDRNFRYYTPFAFANQDIKRIYASDAWSIADDVVLNLRGSYTDRDLDLARNAGGKLVGDSLTGRQLRRQSDRIHDLLFQAEPTWHFDVGGAHALLLAGAEARKIDATTIRSTADLPNIASVNAPVTPETSMGALIFKCDAAHSCDDAKLDARLYGLYGIGQVEIGGLKLRLSGRENWFDTRAEGRSAIPANPGSQHPCSSPQAKPCPFVPGEPVTRHDQRFSWDAGAVYTFVKGVSVFGGYSTTAYPIFNSEEPESVGQKPETGSQLEAGVRLQAKSWISLSSSIFKTTRRNVFVEYADPVTLIDVAQVFSYRTRGWESDLNLHPTQRWNINANFTLQAPKLIDYPQTRALVGNRVPSVPKRLANLWTSYDFPLMGEWGVLQIAGGLRYRSGEYGDAGMTHFLPGATQGDVSAAIEHRGWTLRGGVQNLTDAKVWDYAAGTGSGALPGQGRTFFLSLSAAFQ
jgi:iron complex outermembrane receptor protein